MVPLFQSRNAAGDRSTKFEIVRKALEARDFALISKLKSNK
jgi:hypothetical protein